MEPHRPTGKEYLLHDSLLLLGLGGLAVIAYDPLHSHALCAGLGDEKGASGALCWSNYSSIAVCWKCIIVVVRAECSTRHASSALQ